MACAELSVLYSARLVNKVAARPWHATGHAAGRERAAVPRAGLRRHRRPRVRRRRPRRAGRAGRAGPRPGPPFRRRHPGDEGPGRRRPGPCPGRAGHRGDGHGRRGHGPGLHRRHLRPVRHRQVGVLLLHGLPHRGRLRAGRGLEPGAARAGHHRRCPWGSGPDQQPLRQRAGNAAVRRRPLERGGRPPAAGLRPARAAHARRQLAPPDRPRRPPDPPGPAGRGRGAAPGAGRPHGGPPAHVPPAPGPGRLPPGPGHRPPGPAPHRRRPGASGVAARRPGRGRAGPGRPRAGRRGGLRDGCPGRRARRRTGAGG